MDIKAQTLLDLYGIPQNRNYALDACPALRIKYIGDEQSCLIKVTAAAEGDIQSLIGDLGSEALDANFTLGTATSGNIDVSETAASTMQKIVEFINTLDDYECELLGAKPADATSTYFLADATTGTQAKTLTGTYVYLDSSYNKWHGAVIKPPMFSQKDDFGGGLHTRTNPQNGKLCVIDSVRCVPAFSSGTPQWEFYPIKDMTIDTNNQVIIPFETATTVVSVFNFHDLWGKPLIAPPDHYWLVKLTNSTTWLTGLTSWCVVGRVV